MAKPDLPSKARQSRSSRHPGDAIMSMAPETSGVGTDNLFARARAGDQGAWEELVTACYSKVRRVVGRKLDRRMRSLFDSTDFANDVFKSLVAKSDRFDFPSIEALNAYLVQAAEQKVIDEYRRQHRRKRDLSQQARLSELDGAGPRFEIAGHDPTPSQFVQAEETREQLFSGQPEATRQILEMKAQDYTNEEAAEHTGLHLRKVQRLVKQVGDSWRLFRGENR